MPGLPQTAGSPKGVGGGGATADHPRGGVWWVQVDDRTLEALLDRSHLEQDQAPPYPLSAPGYEVVTHDESSALLSGVNV